MLQPYDFDHSDDFEHYCEIIVDTPLGYRRVSYEALRARNIPTTEQGALALALTLDADDSA